MCGICGEIRFDGESASPERIQRMGDCLARRGPDGSGQVMRGRVGFAHRRLKIIDLSEKAEQPMVDPTLGLTLTFNGCIYNYPELRKELEAKGYAFFSTGDTEVILKAYHAWGRDCVKRFHGMFAFAIHERETGRVMLARDRFGIKPLYLSQNEKRLYIASSLQAILKTGDVDTGIDKVALHHYMTFHAVVPPPHTIIKGVRKLPPATTRMIEADGSYDDAVYWWPDFTARDGDDRLSSGDWRDLVMDAMKLAVDRRMVADVPVGVLLSGGVDSSLIVGLLAEAGQKDLNTFSIGFEDANGEVGNEFEYSDLIAKHYGTEHHKLFIPGDELVRELPNAIEVMSEPMVSYDNIGFYLLSREVAKHIKVVQSGQGADEIFAGYHWYPKVHGANDPLAAYRRAFFDRSRETLATHLSPEWLAETDVSGDFVAAHFAKEGATLAVDKALRIDAHVMLVDDPVKRVDNMTMAWGLEARVPFLDHELVELAARVPAEEKLKQDGKGVLKDVARQIIPSDVIDRKKGYFPVPQLKYLSGSTLDFVKDAMHSDAAKSRGLFQTSYVDELFEHPSDHITPLRGSELWQVALLEMWLQSQGV
ncbi:N-acetylglutaminylglutamine amidotransferase [Fulvimarina sp. 2208YS6-2-32]|uniref:asparagine synthase (glutamine-hydrolyzing) n=1 Tax=Fulvimarina uroteuthidis TaxID=3098149 RepID=A0ABU5HWP9_9HYPH|nr:N-acetylglutaminylglutamine amidotransferase [Fulvimarina sp. 2208YS6-2-32]MDY8107563.1 N-acetylglutaminylglutamine amidotransferase [Fulvimarina sp. 2208YS6-2-32]